MAILEGNNHPEGPMREKQREQEDCNRGGEKEMAEWRRQSHTSGQPETGHPWEQQGPCVKVGEMMDRHLVGEGLWELSLSSTAEAL